MNPAVFLDRDGTINEQMGYINHVSRFRLLPGVAEAIRLLNSKDIPVVVVSNQSGLARGYFPESLVAEVNGLMQQMLAQAGARLDAIYFCPHHPRAIVPQYRQVCECRKPGIGLLKQASADLGLDLARSYVVGDRWSDLESAVNCGASPILVLTGYGRGELAYIGPNREIQPRYVAENLLDAAGWIVRDLKSSEQKVQM